MTPEQIKNKYEPRILQILTSISEALTEETTLQIEGPYDMHDEEYRWCLFITSENDRKENEETNDLYAGIDLRFQILESEHNDGTEDGVNFGVDIVDVQGRILGGLCPFNYTDQVWVPRGGTLIKNHHRQVQAIEERFKLMEQADVGGVVHIIKEWYEDKAEGILRQDND